MVGVLGLEPKPGTLKGCCAAITPHSHYLLQLCVNYTHNHLKSQQVYFSNLFVIWSRTPDSNGDPLRPKRSDLPISPMRDIKLLERLAGLEPAQTSYPIHYIRLLSSSNAHHILTTFEASNCTCKIPTPIWLFSFL